ncbi:MAG: hypothetical protein ACOCWO_03925 [Candidatus Muiribacteriaceae bacterium]
MKFINETLYKYKDILNHNEIIELKVLLYDMLTDDELIEKYFYSESADEKIPYAKVLSMRKNEDLVFLYSDMLFSNIREIRYNSLAALFDMKTFAVFPSLLNEYSAFEPDDELKNIAFLIKTHAPADSCSVEDKADDSPPADNSLPGRLEWSFRIKNLSFPGKKARVIDMIAGTDNFALCQNLLYSLNTEVITDHEKDIIVKLIAGKVFREELEYDLRRLSLIDNRSSSVSSASGFFRKTASIIAAIFSA